MKKAFVSLMSILMVFVLLAGLMACNVKQASDGKTIRIAAFKGAYGDSFWDELVEGFEKLYEKEGYKVEDITSSQSIEDVINPQIKAGQGPDIVYLPTGNKKALTETLIKSKALLNISDVLDYIIPGEEISVKEKILPGFLDNMSIKPYGNNDTYMLPLFYAPFGLFYNQSLFNETGDDGKYKLPETWDDFYNLKDDLDTYNADKSEKDKRYLYAYPMGEYNQELIISGVATNCGIELLNKFLNYEDVYDDANFREVFEKLAGVEQKYLYPSSRDTATNYKDNQNSLLQNRALFLPSGSWMPVEMEDYVPIEGFEYGFMPIFAYESGQTRYVTTKLEQIYILKQSKSQEVAKKFLAYLYSNSAIKIIAEKAQALVPTLNALAIAKENEYIDSVTLSMYDIYSKEGVNGVAFAFASANVPGVNWKEIMATNINSVFAGTKTVDGWLDEIKYAAAQLKNAVVSV